MEKNVSKEAIISFNERQILGFGKNMKLMAPELNDRDLMVILFLLFVKEIIFESIFCNAETRNQLIELLI